MMDTWANEIARCTGTAFKIFKYRTKGDHSTLFVNTKSALYVNEAGNAQDRTNMIVIASSKVRRDC